MSKQHQATLTEEIRVLEALLFASQEILSPGRLKKLIPGEPDARQIRKMVAQLNEHLQKERHPFEVVELGGGYQFRTVAYYHPWLRKLLQEKSTKKLSIQALECLAIIAYKQPLTKAEIESIRGVLSDGAMKTLLERKLVTIGGRSDKPGRPLLYVTTAEFLQYFGINKLSDLPSIEEFEAIAREKMEELSEEALSEIDAAEPEGQPSEPEGEQTEGEQTEAEQTEAEQTEAEQTEGEQTGAEQSEAEQTGAEQSGAERQEGCDNEDHAAEDIVEAAAESEFESQMPSTIPARQNGPAPEVSGEETTDTPSPEQEEKPETSDSTGVIAIEAVDEDAVEIEPRDDEQDHEHDSEN
jgi:segregation and condensation protein B